MLYDRVSSSFLSLSYLASSVIYYQSKRYLSITIALVSGGLAAMIKAPTLSGFLIANLVFITLEWLKKRDRNISYLNDIIIPLIGFIGIPIIAAYGWTNFADSYKLMNSVASQSITSEALKSWNFGTIEQKISPRWIKFIGRCFKQFFGHLIISPIIFFSLLIISRHRRKLMIVCTVIFIIIVSIFTNLHFTHSYYQYANGIFLISAMGFGIIGLVEGQKLWQKNLGLFLFILLLVLQIFYYPSSGVYNPSKQLIASVLKTKSVLQSYTRENEVILIDDNSWNSRIPYYSQRRALSLMSEMTDSSKIQNNPIFQKAFNNLASYHVSAMVLCGESRRSQENINELITLYKFQREPIHASKQCDVYVLSERFKG